MKPRQKPHNRDAERGLLAAVLRNNSVLDDVGQIVRSKDEFYVAANGFVWRAMAGMRAEGQLIDPVTLYEAIARDKEAESECQWAPYIAELHGMANDGVSAKAHARVVHRHHMTRELMRACEETLEDAWSKAFRPEELIAAAERRLFEIGGHGHQGEVVGQKQVIEETLVLIEQRVKVHREGKMPPGCVPYGLRTMDEKTFGMHPGELIVFGARPGVGKSIMGVHIADVASTRGVPSMFVSLEQARTELGQRMLSKHSGINSFRIRGGNLSDEDLVQIGDAGWRIKHCPLWWDDTPNQNVGRISSNARRLRAKHNLQLVVIDYMQLIEASNGKMKRQEQVSEISRRLKLLARELQIPVVAMAQLNRQGDQRSDAEPRLSDLRESGAIEQDADTVILLHKAKQPDQDKQPTDPLKVIVAKQRNGPVCEIRLTHDKAHYALLEPAEPKHGDLP